VDVLLAATATDRSWLAYAVLAAAAVAWLAGYAVACWWWPFAACRRCEGGGKRRSPSGRAWRKCRRCKGTGARLRVGRRVSSWVRGVKDGAP
jgi:hypothetical protein